MSDFREKVNEIITQGREEAERQKRAKAEEHKKRVAAERTRQDAIGRARGIASQFAEQVIQPRMKEIQRNIPGGTLHVETQEDSPYAGCSLRFGESEHLTARLHFDEKDLWLSVEAECVQVGQVYTEESEHFDGTQFDEANAQTWMKSRIADALKAFCTHAEVIRNPQPIVRYGQMEKK